MVSRYAPRVGVLAVACLLSCGAGWGLGCGAPSRPVSPALPVAEPPPEMPPIDWSRHGLAAQGCFLVRVLPRGDERVSDEARCEMPRRPNSTFKIPNALIGLELGILEGPDSVMTWDASTYPAASWWPEAWKRDQPLRDAIRVSAVPAFRRLATQIGPERMQRYVDLLGYGNRDLSGPPDAFWLSGALRITARQQVDLLTRLVEGELPVSAAAQATVREVLLLEERDGLRFYGKTGSGNLETRAADAPGDGPSVGWMVGWVESRERTWVYAMWVEADTYAAMKERRTTTVADVLGELTTR
jgi:beta-lactamase class D